MHDIFLQPAQCAAGLLVRHWPRLWIAVRKPERTCREQRLPELVTAAAAA